MRSYYEEIYDDLLGVTPKQKFDYYSELKKRERDFRTDLTSLRPLIEGLQKTPDDAMVGHIKIFIDRLAEIAFRNNP